jgi:hypothetical protein
MMSYLKIIYKFSEKFIMCFRVHFSKQSTNFWGILYIKSAVGVVLFSF